MSCFSLPWIESLCVWVVIIAAIIAVLKIVIPWVLQKLGGIDTGPLIPVLVIVFKAIIAIIVIYIIFALLACLLGAGGHLSLMPPR